jgi:hypothetical protein
LRTRSSITPKIVGGYGNCGTLILGLRFNYTARHAW